MKLHFRVIGDGNPVVILHGLLGSSDNWQTFGKQLGSSGYKIYLVDLRNHGLSPHSEEMNYAVMAEDVNELFKTEGLEKAVVIGHSLGGKTAMSFAFKYPQKINGLVVIDIAPRQYGVQHRKILDALLSIDASQLKSRQEAEQQLSSQLDEQSTIQFLMKNLYWKEKTVLDWRFNLPVINKNIVEVGKEIKPQAIFSKPTLFIKGEKSDYVTYDDEREIFDLFENVEVKTAPGAGHWVHADNPMWLLDEIKKFLMDRMVTGNT